MAELFTNPLLDVGAGLTPSDGSKLFFSESGLSFAANPKDSFSDITGDTAHANPVIADSRGVFPGIYLTGTYRGVLKDKNDVQIWQVDNINSQGFGNDAWVSFANTPTQTSSTTFTLVGDQTSTFQVGRRVKLEDTVDLFGAIITSVFTSLTTVTVTLDTGSLTGSLVAVSVGISSTQREIGAETVNWNSLLTDSINRTLTAKLNSKGVDVDDYILAGETNHSAAVIRALAANKVIHFSGSVSNSIIVDAENGLG